MTYGQLDTLYNTRYTVVYSYYYRLPVKVTWKLYKTDVLGDVKRDKTGFKTDKRLKPPRITAKDYTNSGYQRGHMCPSADWSSSRSNMRETYLMSNIAPQTAHLNNGAWKEDEIITRSFAVMYDSVLVQCGTIFDPYSVARFSKHGIAIPPRYWKTVRVLANDSVLFNRYYENN